MVFTVKAFLDFSVCVFVRQDTVQKDQCSGQVHEEMMSGHKTSS